ncbi:MAG: alpha-galactosidase [Spirochaetales bacterium]|nr:alpha-galactosidase [Spirochaetales bacterium]
MKIVIVGAGSESFGPKIIRDVYLSDELNRAGVELVLMDIVPEHLTRREKYANTVAERMKRSPRITSTTRLDKALHSADYVITAIERDRYLYWSQDFHVPRQYGFMQVYGENGGPGGLFHALRNMGPMIHIARRMEALCPGGILLNFSNPESKLCQAVSMLTEIRAYGLCHGVSGGRRQIASFLRVPVERLETTACGMNHFTWFQTIRDKTTGEDLYPVLSENERRADPLADWDDLALSRICLRTFGLWPSPGANHIGEYIRWAQEFLASSALQYYYDPATGHPWETGNVPRFVYSLSSNPTGVALFTKNANTDGESKGSEHSGDLVDLLPSGELAVPIMEALSCGAKHELGAVIVPNGGAIPGIDPECVVEVPAVADENGVRSVAMDPLPEAITAIVRTQGSIQKLLVEAYADASRRKLLQAILLDPTAHSYRNAVGLINEMCELQKDLLPALEWQ